MGIKMMVKVKKNIKGVIGIYFFPKKKGTNSLVLAMTTMANIVPSIVVASRDFFKTFFWVSFPWTAICGMITREILVITPRIMLEIRWELS